MRFMILYKYTSFHWRIMLKKNEATVISMGREEDSEKSKFRNMKKKSIIILTKAANNS